MCWSIKFAFQIKAEDFFFLEKSSLGLSAGMHFKQRTWASMKGMPPKVSAGHNHSIGKPFNKGIASSWAVLKQPPISKAC